MGKIFYIIGKSACGKDTIYNRLMEDEELKLKGIVRYTTRPMRNGEEPGREYFFVTQADVDRAAAEGKVIETRTYNTVYGPWTYAMIDDGQVDLSSGNYLMVGILSSYVEMKQYFGEEAIVPVYIEIDDYERLLRAMEREKNGRGQYAEMCRRFLADDADFSEKKLAQAGITRKYLNYDFEKCLAEIKKEIVKTED